MQVRAGRAPRVPASPDRVARAHEVARRHRDRGGARRRSAFSAGAAAENPRARTGWTGRISLSRMYLGEAASLLSQRAHQESQKRMRFSLLSWNPHALSVASKEATVGIEPTNKGFAGLSSRFR